MCVYKWAAHPGIMDQHHIQLASMFLEYNTALSEKYFHDGLQLMSMCIHGKTCLYLDIVKFHLECCVGSAVLKV